MASTIHRSINKKEKKLSYDKEEYKSVIDYVILYYLIGNDFLPHHPSLSLRSYGSEQLVNAIHQIYIDGENLFIMKSGRYEINWIGMNKIFHILSKNEYDYMRQYKDMKQERKEFL